MIIWLSPGDPSQRTGGYLYNARMVEALRRAGREVRVLPVEGPWPDAGDAETVAATLADIPAGAVVVADGLCWPGLGEAGKALVRRNKVVVLVHSLLCRETGLSTERMNALDQYERESWPIATMLVATSALTREEVRARGQRGVEVIVPGSERAERAPSGDGTHLLSVATVVPRKGHDVLLDALAEVEGDWTLTCAGAVRDPAWGEHLQGIVAERGWQDRVRFVGSLDEEPLAEELARADLLLQPARYEAYGMAIAEGVARGLPVLTAHAGVLDYLPPGAVQIVDGEAKAWAHQLRRYLGDADLRRCLSDRAWRAAGELPDWDAQAQRWMKLLDVL